MPQEFLQIAPNYRYLTEACLSDGNNGTQPVMKQAVLEALGAIDWLLVLHETSDVLHNEVDVGGLEITDDFVPAVFYSDEFGWISFQCFAYLHHIEPCKVALPARHGRDRYG
jgi:hypothetical protein